MNESIIVNLSMNYALFGSLLMLATWLSILGAIKLGYLGCVPGYLWRSSFASAILALAQPAFVPEFWDPPTVARVWRLDVGSIVLCFTFGGVAMVAARQALIVRLARSIEQAVTPSWAQNAPSHVRLIEHGERRTAQYRLENLVFVTFFFAIFAATRGLYFNTVGATCTAGFLTALLLFWLRPHSRAKAISGSFSFLSLYALLLIAVNTAYPNYNQSVETGRRLTGIQVLGAPIEKFVLVFVVGMVWVPVADLLGNLRTGFKQP